MKSSHPEQSFPLPLPLTAPIQSVTCGGYDSFDLYKLETKVETCSGDPMEAYGQVRLRFGSFVCFFFSTTARHNAKQSNRWLV